MKRSETCPSRKTVLVVDDERPVRDMIQALLELEGYSVLTACDGKMALEIVHNIISPCLILLDVIMPRLNGRDVVRELCRDPETARIPVVLITATSSDAIAIPKVVDRIAKPIQLAALLNVVHRHCA